MKKIIHIIFIGLILFVSITQANNLISLNLAKVSTKEALKYLAKFSDKNIVISQAVQGDITIFLKNVTWQHALHVILQTQKLGERTLGKVIYVAPIDEIIKQQQMMPPKPLSTMFIRLNYAKAADVAKLFTAKKSNLLTTHGSVIMDKRTNSLMIFDDKEQLGVIKSFIRKLDIPMRQVLIEARIANIDEDYAKEFGVKFGMIHGDYDDAHVDMNLMHKAFGKSLDVELHALENKGHATIISSPHLLTANRQTATIETGEEIPYQESTGQGNTSTAFKKAVLSLQVTPQIAPNNKIILYLKVNQDKRSSQEVQGVPAIDTNHLATQVLLDNGQTIVLGGIFEDTKTKHIDGIPFLGDLPVVGILFRRQKIVDNRRELLIFVTPRILPQKLSS